VKSAYHQVMERERKQSWRKTFKNLAIKPDEIIELVEAVDRRKAEGRADPFSTPLAVLKEKHPDDTFRAVVIMERMRCMSEVMKDERMSAWKWKDADDRPMIHDAVFRVTAIAPIRWGRRTVRFDPDEFLKLVLSEAPPEATA
jgi:hypothetical protein